MPELMKLISFAKLDQGMQMPHLLDIQTCAFESLLQLDAASQNREDIGLERVFTRPVGLPIDAPRLQK